VGTYGVEKNAEKGLYLCVADMDSANGVTVLTAPMVYVVGVPAILPLVTVGCADGCLGVLTVTVDTLLTIVVLLLPIFVPF